MLNRKPRLSVCIPTYIPEEDTSRLRYIKDAIESVLNQDFENFELIISDQSTHNRTEKLVESYLDIRIKYFKYEKIGYGINLQKCLELASGEYITYLNDDDILLKGALKRIDGFLNKNPEVSVCTRSFLLFRDIYPKNNRYYILECKEKCNEDKVIDVDSEKIKYFFYSVSSPGFLSGLTIKLEDCKRVGGFPANGNFSQFAPVFNILYKLKRKGGYISEYIVTSREHSTNLGSAGNIIATAEEMISYFKEIFDLISGNPKEKEKLYQKVILTLTFGHIYVLPKNRMKIGYIATVKNLIYLIKIDISILKFWEAWAIGLLALSPIPAPFMQKIVKKISNIRFYQRTKKTDFNNYRVKELAEYINISSHNKYE